MSEISDKKTPTQIGPSALYSGFRNFEVALKLAFFPKRESGEYMSDYE